MNRNVSTIKEINKSNIQVGHLVEALNDFGIWETARIIKVTENKLVLHFLNKNLSRILNLSSNKWRLFKDFIFNENNDDVSIENNNIDEFKIGDIILARWLDDRFYLAKILDINIKTKFGIKTKEYRIIYLYDNIKDSVLETRIKAPTFEDLKLLNENEPMKQGNKKLTSKKKPPNNMLLTERTCDDVFYDEKTKNFAEKCRRRRQRLSQDSDLKQNEIISPITEIIVNNDAIRTDCIKNESKKRLNFKPIKDTISQQQQQQRISQRKRKCPYKNSDYFYPESFDQIFSDKTSSNLSSSIPINHRSSSLIPNNELNVDKSNETVWNESENKDTEISLNSPDIVSFTSEETPNKKFKVSNDFDESSKIDKDNCFSSTDDGKFKCSICSNKTFRKKQSVLDHIKHYHQNDTCSPTHIVSPQRSKFPPKRYFSSYLKNNRGSIDPKRPLKRYTKSFRTITNPSTLRTDNSYKKTYSTHLKYRHYTDNTLIQSPYGKNNIHNIQSTSQIELNKKSDETKTTIIYCHRCKRCNDDGLLVQCDVCLCWSHATCYNLTKRGNNRNKNQSQTTDLLGNNLSSTNSNTGIPLFDGNDESFWACDDCSNVSSTTTNTAYYPQSPTTIGCSTSNNNNTNFYTKQWFRDKWRFYHLPKNQFPYGFNSDNFGSNNNHNSSNILSSNPINNNQSTVRNDNYRNLIEIQSILSTCQRVLESITRNIDKVHLVKSSNNVPNNESNSQDELDILKTLNIDDINLGRIDSLCPDPDELFIKETSNNINCTVSSAPHNSTNCKLLESHLPTSSISFAPSVSIPFSSVETATYVTSIPTTSILNTRQINTGNDQVGIDTGLMDDISHHDLSFNELHFINSTPNKCQTQITSTNNNSNSLLHTISNNNGENNSTNKLLNTSLDGIFDCDIQKLDFIPKADFDALVKDLSNCEDICKNNNNSNNSNTSIDNSTISNRNGNNNISLSHNNSSRIHIQNNSSNESITSQHTTNFLDILDDQPPNSHLSSINRNNNTNSVTNKLLFTSPSNKHQFTPTCLFSSNNNSNSNNLNNNISDPPVSLIDTEFTSFLINPEHSQNAMIKDPDLLETNQKYANTMKSDFGKLSEPIMSNKIPCSTHQESDSYQPLLGVISSMPSQRDLDLTASDLGDLIGHNQRGQGSGSDFHGNNGHNNHYDDSNWLSSSLLNNHNSNNNNNCNNNNNNPYLLWLVGKYSQVEKIVDVISDVIVKSDNTNPSNLDYSRVSRYLQHVLFVLRKSETGQ